MPNPIAVILTTWPNCPQRIEYLDKTLAALRSNLTAGDRPLEYVVSSEYETGSLFDRMMAVIGHYGAIASVRPKSRPNLGAHLNWAFRQASRLPLKFYCQDDWVLKLPLDIADAADLLEKSPKLACVRYYTAFTKFVSRDARWARIDKRGPYPVADNPMLLHQRWFDTLGPYGEGGDAGAHENNMASRFSVCGLDALAPIEVADFGPHYFLHIGDLSAFPEKRQR